MPLDPRAGAIVLLGLIAASGAVRCEQERLRVQSDLDKHVAFELAHFRDGDDMMVWADRERMWVPVSCSVEFVSTNNTGFVSAPSVTFLAQRGTLSKRRATFTVCRLGLLRVETEGWPEEIARPTLPKQPVNVADAVAWAQRILDRALPPLLAFVDPIKG